jgi:hypothetical protein
MGAMTRWRAWAPAAKAAALFVLPVPLLLAALAALIRGDLPRLGLTGGALVCFGAAAVAVSVALAAQARYFLGERLDPPAIPLKLLSAILTALGACLAALAGGHAPAAALVFAGLGAVGHLAFYGLDVRPPRIQVAVVDGVDRAAVTLQLKTAYGRLRGIDTAARAIAAPELRERLSRITGVGRAILGEIERDPRDAQRARRFLHLYLESAERVTSEYARTHGRARTAALDAPFGQMLVEMERTFTEQHRKLVEHDLVALDVDIDVLNARLTREGLG